MYAPPAHPQQFTKNGDDFIKFVLFTLGNLVKMAGAEQQKLLVQNTIDLFAAVIPCVRFVG